MMSTPSADCDLLQPDAPVYDLRIGCVVPTGLVQRRRMS